MGESASEVGSCTSDLRVLLESGEGADLTLVVGNLQLPAHSFILAVRSPVFAAMMRNDMQEATSRRIEIKDMREAVMRQVLSFVYTDTAPELEGMAAELLAAADKYDLPLLKKRCEQQMARDVSVENAAATAAVAVLHRCPGLMRATVEFIVGHPEVMATGGWERLLRDHAEAAVEVCKQVAVTPAPLAQQLAPPPKSATKTSSTESQSPESRAVPAEMNNNLANRLREAVQCGKPREVWALLAAGAPKDVRGGAGNTLLHLAGRQGNASTVRLLLDAGLSANAVNSSGQTPLHAAAQGSNRDVVWMLVAASAHVDAQDNRGQTPLHLAAQWNVAGKSLVEVVNALLLAGARKDIKDLNGKTPRDVATTWTSNAFSTHFGTSTICHPYYDL